MKKNYILPCKECILYALCRTKLKSEFKRTMTDEINAIQQKPKVTVGDRIRTLIFSSSIINNTLSKECEILNDYMNDLSLMNSTVISVLKEFNISLPFNLYINNEIEIVKHAYM